MVVFPGAAAKLKARSSAMSKPVVLITGALTGIGRATAFAFAQEGSRVVISGRRDDAGALVTQLRALGAEAEFVRADVRREDDVRNLVDKTVERFGRLDGAVNNAGTEGQPGPLTEQSAETYAATFDTNVLGTLLDVEIVRSSEAPGGVGEAGTAGVVRRLSTRSTLLLDDASIRCQRNRTCSRSPPDSHHPEVLRLEQRSRWR